MSSFQSVVSWLFRNYGLGNTVVKMEMKSLKHQKGEFIMCVGKHEAKVILTNKYDNYLIIDCY